MDNTERKHEPMLTKPVKLLVDVHVQASAALNDKGLDQVNANTARRILREMKDILREGHSEMDV